MAFNGLQTSSGPFSLDVGGQVQVWVVRDDGSDFGAQWIQASSIGPGTLQVDQFVKSRTINADGQSFLVMYLLP